MKIIAQNGLTKISKEIEDRTSEQKELENFKVEIKVIGHFSNSLIEELIPGNPAAYFRENDEIQVKHFLLKMDHHIQLAIIVHEIGESYVSKKNIPLLRNKFGITLPKDILVDRLVCKWGFEKEIQNARNRENDYGEEYAIALKSWDNLEEYIDKMTKWNYSRYI